MSLKSLTRKIITSIRDDFNLDSAEARQFFRSQWELIESDSEPNSTSHTWKNDIVSLKYLIYRGLYMLILVSCITFSTTCQSHLFHLFLTNWSFTSQNLYAILFFTSVLWRWWTINRNSSRSQVSPHKAHKHINKNTNLELGMENVDNLLDSDHKHNKKSGGGNFDTVDEGQNGQSGPPPSTPSTLKLKKKPQQELQDCEGDVVDIVLTINHDENFGNASTYTVSDTELRLTFLEKSIWLLVNITHVLPYCVVLGYWCVVYKYDPDQPACEKFRSHFIVHGATAFLALFDALIIAIPVRRSHFLIPTGMVLLYLIFTFLHEAAGGPYRPGKTFIYSVLDWKEKPTKALIFSIFGVLSMPLAHTVFCWGVYKLRTWIFSCKNKKRTENQPD